MWITEENGPKVSKKGKKDTYATYLRKRGWERKQLSFEKAVGGAITSRASFQLKLIKSIYKREAEIFRKLIKISEESMKGF